MKDRRKRNGVVSWSTFFCCTLLVVLSCILITTLAFSPFTPPTPQWNPPRAAASRAAAITIREAVMLPDQALVFLSYPPSFPFHTQRDLLCLHFNADSARTLSQPPIQVHLDRLRDQIVRCALPPRGNTLSLLIKSKRVVQLQPEPSSVYKWTPLVYEAFFDRDNTTIVFVKGLNLRPERLIEPSKFKCLFGWDFTNPKFVLKSNAVSAAQEIIRCKTPKSILTDQAQAQAQAQAHAQSIKVTIQVDEREIFPSIGRPGLRQLRSPPRRKAHELCICTMLRNQARFIKEWIMYHTRIGVQRWFIYDNDSNDDIENVISSLQSIGYNISQHLWPWVKTQEAGFAHCALRARASCEWVGFIDVDEYFNVKIKGGLQSVIWHHARHGRNVGEIRTRCYSFGPSGLRQVPREGVMVGYTCRLRASERHKSIVRPEALNQSLINVVHHFHLREPFVSVEVKKGVMVINHYKYQVWKVFKKKFQRRVATYVADWRQKQNAESKDRVPGLGTKAVEPPDWANRFCQVRDMGLRNMVMREFLDRRIRLLPWQPEFEHHFRRKRRRKVRKPI